MNRRCGVVVVLGALLLAAPASAGAQGWTPIDPTKTNKTVTLTGRT